MTDKSDRDKEFDLSKIKLEDILQDEVFKIVERQGSVDPLPRLPLQEYRALFEGTEPPTEAQIEDFVRYVSEAKSWYKHLPLWPPGVPFFFFLDPHAGMDRGFDRDGHVSFFPRDDDSERFHYSWLTTKEHHTRFGLLGFATESGSRLFAPSRVVESEGQEAPTTVVLDNNPYRISVWVGRQEYELPPEILEVGTAQVTGVVHRSSAKSWCWSWLTRVERAPDWPEESGGAETIEKIRAYCNRPREERLEAKIMEGDPDMWGVEPDLYELLSPERRRVRNNMRDAIRRVVQLTYG